MRNKIFTLIVSAIALLVAACIPDTETETFLSDPNPAKLDGRLLGTWYKTRDNNVLLMNFRRVQGQNGVVFEVVADDFEPARSKIVKRYRYRVWTTKIGSHTYLNLRLIDVHNEKRAPKQILVYYEVRKDGTLAFAFIDDDKSEKLVETGALAGRIKGKDFNEGAVITASREKLIALLREKGPKVLFMDKMLVTTRLKPALQPGD